MGSITAQLQPLEPALTENEIHIFLFQYSILAVSTLLFKSYLCHISRLRQLFGNNSDAMELLLMWPQLIRGQMLCQARVATFHSFH